MNIDNKYLNQAKIILHIIPMIFKHKVFALKGETALNFFYRNLPRLSVDIDLTYLEIDSRKTAIKKINNEMKFIKENIEKNTKFKVQYTKSLNDQINKLLVISKNERVKIEPNLIIRGNVLPVKYLTLSQEAQKTFELNVKAVCLDFKEIIASKIVAALDRQHPRDLFDIMLFLEENGKIEEIMDLFIVFLLQSPRPLIELINPNLKD